MYREISAIYLYFVFLSYNLLQFPHFYDGVQSPIDFVANVVDDDRVTELESYFQSLFELACSHREEDHMGVHAIQILASLLVRVQDHCLNLNELTDHCTLDGK